MERIKKQYMSRQEGEKNILEQEIAFLKEKFEKDPNSLTLEERERLLELLEEEKLKKGTEGVKKPEKKEKIELPKDIRGIKHRIIQILSPIDIDLQGIEEVFREDALKAVDYLAEVLEGKPENYYKQKLQEIRRIVGLEPDSPENNLKDLLKDSEIFEDKAWQSLKELLGSENITESPIYPLFNKLDELIKGKKAFEKLVEESKTPIFPDEFSESSNGLSIRQIIDFNFHDWFVELNQVLEEIIEERSKED